MLDIEVQAHGALPPTKRTRFEYLLSMRDALARASASLCCWGVVDAPVLDRQLVLLEDALTDMVADPEVAAMLCAEWAVNDATLLHETGTADWCTVCTRGGYGMGDLLGSLFPIGD